MLKSWSKIDFIQSVVFPGQLSFSSFDRCHVFKMTTRGLGSRVNIVDKMHPIGELGNCYVCFNHVKRVCDWRTMACHVYNPFL